MILKIHRSLTSLQSFSRITEMNVILTRKMGVVLSWSETIGFPVEYNNIFLSVFFMNDVTLYFWMWPILLSNPELVTASKRYICMCIFVCTQNSLRMKGLFSIKTFAPTKG